MITEEKRARLEEIEEAVSEFGHPSTREDAKFLISELEAAWEREAVLEGCLRRLRLLSSVAQMDSHTVEALTKVRQMRGES